jgi:hypothetical protein
MAESKILNQVMDLVNSFCTGMEIFRNNSGVFKRVRFGLHNKLTTKGTADCIGWKTVVITPNMVGKRFARFLSIELKDTGEKIIPGSEQDQWRKKVLAAGGIAIEADSPEAVQELLFKT